MLSRVKVLTTADADHGSTNDEQLGGRARFGQAFKQYPHKHEGVVEEKASLSAAINK